MYNHDPQIQRWFNSERWRKIRNYVIQQHPFCQQCLGNGIYTPTEEVHHVIPVQSVPSTLRESTMFNVDNLLCVCRSCHKMLDARGKTASRRREYCQIRTDSACAELFDVDKDKVDALSTQDTDNQTLASAERLAQRRCKRR